MAQLDRPFDLDNLQDLVPLTKWTTDDLPDHVKDTVWWLDQPEYPAGYYIYNQQEQQPTPVEFVENHWHHIYQYSGTVYTSLVKRIEPHTLGTGYWGITDPQHPNFEENWNLTHAAGSSTEPPRLTITTYIPSLLSDPTL
jgi:hypothetical protein